MTIRWEDLEPGSEPEPQIVGPITRTDIVRYQGASGDFYPIHHDEPFAKEAGLPAPLGIGMYHAGLLASWATDWLSTVNCRSIRFRWKAPVFPGDTLKCYGRIARKFESSGERRVEIELFCQKQDDAIAALGWATFVVPES